MSAIRGAPWDDWWDNLASQGHWTLPASQARRVSAAEAKPAAPAAPPQLTNGSGHPERVASRPEIEDLQTAVSQLDREKRRLEENLALAQQGLQERAELKASLEFLEAENLFLRRRLLLLERR